MLNYLLIPVLKVKGAAIATLATNFLLFFLSYIFSQKFYPIPYKLRNIILTTCGFITLAFAGYYIDIGYISINITLKVLTAGLFFYFLIHAKIVQKEEIIALLKSILSKFGKD